LEQHPYVERIQAGVVSVFKNEHPLLVELDLELTERCNNDCIHCYINQPADSTEIKNREISTDTIKKILGEAAGLGCFKVRFTGGEPLLREDFEEIYLYSRKLGLKVTIFTNATLITPRLVELFVHIPPLKYIEITLYGMNKKSYEAVTRNSGSFAAAWRGINLLMEKEVPFIVKYAVLPPNRGDIAQFETWASTIPWMDDFPGYVTSFDLRARHDSEKKNRTIRKLRTSPEERLQVFTQHRAEYIKGMKTFCSQFMGPPGDILFSCGAGLANGCVDAYGKMQPCLLLRHPDSVYDLKSGTICDAMENFFPKIRQLKVQNPDYLDRCAGCFIKGLCDQCPAKAWMEHGTFDTPVQYLCDFAHSQARDLGLLKERENAWEVINWEERIRDFSEKELV
jgi:radical SAM protein with 4Fe4S-binding SPASM domain